MGIHSDLFGGVFSGQAGKQRGVDVAFNGRAVSTPGQIPYRLVGIVDDARTIINVSRGLEAEQLVNYVSLTVTRWHAECIVVQPFIDGNKRWARQILSALLVDCGFWPGVRIEVADRSRYIEGIDKSIAGDQEQLADLILESWLRLERDFAEGTY